MVTPYGEGQLKAHSKNALSDFGSAFAQRMGCRVEARRIGRVGRIVPAHIEALHNGQAAVKVAP